MLLLVHFFAENFLLRIVNAASSVDFPQKWRQKDGKKRSCVVSKYFAPSESCFFLKRSITMSFAFSSEALGPGVQLSMAMGAFGGSPMVGSARCPVPTEATTSVSFRCYLCGSVVWKSTAWTWAPDLV